MVKRIDDPGSDRHVMAGLGEAFRRGRTDLEKIGARRIDGFRVSIVRLLDLIPPGGIRPTALAERANITKQAVGQRLDELVSRGWVAVTPDPDDGRARLVRLTAAGRRTHRDTRRWIAEVEASWAPEVGPADYATFRRVLDQLARSG